MSAQRNPAPRAANDTALEAASSDVEIAARAMCRGMTAGRCGGCAGGNDCMADDMFGRAALRAVSALRAAGRMLTPPPNRPCVERSESGSCLACDAGQGEACQHPSLKL